MHGRWLIWATVLSPVVLGLVGLLLSGCASVGAPYPRTAPYTTTVEAAIDGWPGELSADCAELLREDLRLAVLWGEAFLDQCGARCKDGVCEPLGAGCTRDRELVVAQPQHPEVVAHELLHIGLWCETGNPDHYHRTPGLWRDGLERELRGLWR